MKTDQTYRVKFSTRGRVTIPAPLRKEYGVKGGTKMTLEVTPSGAILLKPLGARSCASRRGRTLSPNFLRAGLADGIAPD